MHSRSIVARGGLAVVAASAALMVTSPAAGADTGAQAQNGAATGTVVQGGKSGYTVNLGGSEPTGTVLFNLKLADGSLLKMYCVQIEVSTKNGDEVVEHSWDDYPDAKSPFRKNNDKVNWVLQHGYPTTGADSLAKAVTGGGTELHGGLSTVEAITATQAAVWHFSDDKDLDRDNPLAGKASADDAADVLAVYDYLTGKDNTGIGEQPKPALTITPAKASGTAGEKIGPFTVSTTGAVTDLSSELPEGVTLVDEDGNEVKTADVKDGTKLYLQVDKDAKPGTAELAIKAAGDVQTGRLFVSKDYAKHPTQSLIVAESQKTAVEANATGTWTEAGAATTTPAPSSQAPAGGQAPLANTGVNAALPIGIGAALVIAGGAMLLVVRRRRGNA
ncbi:thioester domain-containing protein [Amycolatopsis jiangsuensis]|uniref:TQXA domain-containing protein n=1 Tax=Amycolatopsis jiangsuensis TaxID=1181879 RepID=A0A840J4S4_9PSEU|nr:thioester domain-containing protein [Amycolatopsis jiangsuensis]MBB4688408.1 TQXA domain-containing protein [Amycolatopsis jiangsuensis]